MTQKRHTDSADSPGGIGQHSTKGPVCPRLEKLGWWENCDKTDNNSDNDKQ